MYTNLKNLAVSTKCNNAPQSLYRNVKYINHASEEFNPPVAPRDLPSPTELPYVTLRDSTCGGTSRTATVAVTTRGVPLLIRKNTYYYLLALVAELNVSSQLCWRSLTYRHRGVIDWKSGFGHRDWLFFVYGSSTSKSSTTSQCASSFCTEHHKKNESTYFF